VVGLVAGRLVEEYKRPVVVLQEEGAESTGSARSVGDFNLVECLKTAQHTLVKFGGHKQAAGLTVRTEQLSVFYQSVLDYADSHEVGVYEKELLLEATLREQDLTVQNCQRVSQFEPFGVENPSPLFLLPAAVVRSMRQVGATGKHLQLRVVAGDTTLECIAFNLGHWAGKIREGDRVDLACAMTLDSWQGMTKLKLRIQELQLHE
jgi:single-stranded-DNA-specific exonuclease